MMTRIVPMKSNRLRSSLLSAEGREEDWNYLVVSVVFFSTLPPGVTVVVSSVFFSSIGGLTIVVFFSTTGGVPVFTRASHPEKTNAIAARRIWDFIV